MKYFKVEESPVFKKYVIYPNIDAMPLGKTFGSYGVIAARLFGMSYPDYLRMCRDVFGAELVGKNKLYVAVTFSNQNDADRLCKELDIRAKLNLQK